MPPREPERATPRATACGGRFPEGLRACRYHGENRRVARTRGARHRTRRRRSHDRRTRRREDIRSRADGAQPERGDVAGRQRQRPERGVPQEGGRVRMGARELGPRRRRRRRRHTRRRGRQDGGVPVSRTATDDSATRTGTANRSGSGEATARGGQGTERDVRSEPPGLGETPVHDDHEPAPSRDTAVE